MINVSDLKPGVTFQMDGNLFVVLDYSHNKTARAAANVKVKMKNLRTGSTTEMTFGGNDKVKRAQIDKKEMQYLYNTGDAFVFMDGETYEQIEIDDRKGISYHESLKQILRHDPDVIMVGEVRDEKTAQLALTCALTGHLVLTTIHASNCINTIKRLENLNISSLDLEDVLLGIMTQKMRFNDKKEVFILSEYIDQKNLLKYFDRKKIDYYDFSKAACTLKNVGVLNEK